MAEALKAGFGPEVVRRLAAAVATVYPAFDVTAFEADALDGFDALELMARGQRIADALRRHLPADFSRALELLLASAERTPEGPRHAMAGFFWLPHTLFVARHGLAEADFERSMHALHALTQRFTAEFAIRAFLGRDAPRTLAVLRGWARDPSPRVRRLVSEGTRPRLPWAPRLEAFCRDPAPLLPLLEVLKDDPSEDVRRSVANSLNDIGKDHPDTLLELCRRWLVGASAERRRLVGHALRSLARQRDPRALQLLGFGARPRVRVEERPIEPAGPRIGQSVRVAAELVSEADAAQDLRVDLRVGYPGADGRLRSRVFALGSVRLAPLERRTVGRRISLRQMTTRSHYPGEHPVELVLNGEAFPLGRFVLRPAASASGAAASP